MQTVDFKNVTTQGLESSPVADALAGLRANEARYFDTKYKHPFTVEVVADAPAPLGSSRSSPTSAASRSRPSRCR